MSFSENEQYVLALSKNKEFVSENEANSIYQKLVSEGKSSTFDYAFVKFLKTECPNCGKRGLFKFHLFGNLKHTECGNNWYISPGTYAGIQLTKTFRAGMGFGANVLESAEEDKRKGKKSSTFLGPLFAFIIGSVFRLVFAIISIPIQIILFLLNQKSKQKLISEG